jgi:hypothetical protein
MYCICDRNLKGVTIDHTILEGTYFRFRSQFNWE